MHCQRMRRFLPGNCSAPALRLDWAGNLSSVARTQFVRPSESRFTEIATFNRANSARAIFPFLQSSFSDSPSVCVYVSYLSGGQSGMWECWACRDPNTVVLSSPPRRVFLLLHALSASLVWIRMCCFWPMAHPRRRSRTAAVSRALCLMLFPVCPLG